MTRLKFLVPGIAVLALGLWGCGKVYSPLNAGPASTKYVRPEGLIEDFEAGNQYNAVGGTDIANCDNLNMGSYVNGDIDGVTSPTEYPYANLHFVPGNPLAGGSPGRACEISGAEGPQVSPWPWVALTFDSSSALGADLSSLAPNHCIVFAYKAGPNSVGKEHLVEIDQSPTTDYGWYQYAFYPADTNWHWMKVYFPNGSGTPMLAQPTWAIPVPWTDVITKVVSINIVFVSNPSGVTTYDLTIDDVQFE